MKKLNFKKISLGIAIGAAAIYIATCAWVYFRQEKILFHPKKIELDKKFSFRVPFEDVWIDADGAKLHGLYFRTQAVPPKGMIIFFHGNDQTADKYGESAAEFTNQGFDYFVPDYRSYGKSSGIIQSEKQFLSDIDRFYEWAKTQYPEEKIALAGRSLGGVAALYLASKSKPRLTVAIATFFNISAMADIRYPYFPKFLLRYHLPNNIWIAQAQSPVYVICGAEDKTIPPAQSERLAALTKDARPAFVVPGASHGDLQKFPLYHQILSDLLNKE